MGSVSATFGPDTELQVPDEILQNFGMKTSFSKDVPKLSTIRVHFFPIAEYLITVSIAPSTSGSVGNLETF